MSDGRRGSSVRSRRFGDVAEVLIADLLDECCGGQLLVADCKANQGRLGELIERSEARRPLGGRGDRPYSVSAGGWVVGLRARTPNMAT